jgi:hypothetical protein
MPDIIVNYWNLNSVYVVIVVLVFIAFLVINYILFNRFQILISKELNTDCKNPLAIYFHKDERDRCLSDKIMKNTEMRVPKINFESKVKQLNDKIANTNQRIVNVSNNFEKTKDVAPELVKVDKMVTDVSNVYHTILYKKYEIISNDTGKMINGIVENGQKIAGFKDIINDNIIKLIAAGDILLDKIIQKIPGNKNWYKGTEVKTFNNIINYLKIASDPNVNPNINLETQEKAKDAITNANKNINLETQEKVKDAVTNYQNKFSKYSKRMNVQAIIKDKK